MKKQPRILFLQDEQHPSKKSRSAHQKDLRKNMVSPNPVNIDNLDNLDNLDILHLLSQTTGEAHNLDLRRGEGKP